MKKITIKLLVFFSFMINAVYGGKVIIDNKSNKTVDIKFDVQGLDKNITVYKKSYKTWKTSRDLKSIEAQFSSGKKTYNKKTNIKNNEATIITITGTSRPTIKVKSFYTLSAYNPFDYEIKVFLDVKLGKNKTVTIKPKKWKGIFKRV